MPDNVEKDKKWIAEIYMLHENEMWLNEQAQKGLMLKKFDNRYAYFSQEGLQNINYKIIVLDKKVFYRR